RPALLRRLLRGRPLRRPPRRFLLRGPLLHGPPLTGGLGCLPSHAGPPGFTCRPRAARYFVPTSVARPLVKYACFRRSIISVRRSYSRLRGRGAWRASTYDVSSGSPIVESA